MATLRIYEVLEELKRLPVIRVEDVVRRGYSRKSAEQLLIRLCDRGVIKRIKRGVYTLKEDPLEYITSIVIPSYISFEYAASVHGLSEQIPMRYTLATTRRVRDIVVPEIPLYVEYLRIPQWLNFGYEKLKGSLIATPEKVVIDCIYKLRCPLREFREVGYEWDLDRIEEYLKYIKNEWLKKKVREFFMIRPSRT